MRERRLNITLIMQVDAISDIVAPGGPKQIIDAYMASQPAGSSHRYGLEERMHAKLMSAEMDIIVESRADAANKMNAIENNLVQLPKIRSLKFWYIESEKNVNNVPGE